MNRFSWCTGYNPFFFFSFLAAAPIAAGVPAAGAGQPARVSSPAGAPSAAPVPAPQLAGGGSQHPPEAPADPSRAAAAARGPFPGNALENGVWIHLFE